MTSPACRVLVTGSRGFIGKNLVVRLVEEANFSVLQYSRGDDPSSLAEVVPQVDAIVHLAGANRPADPHEFERVNVELTRELCEAIRANGKEVPLLLASSSQAELNNPYGRSKRAAEGIVSQLAESAHLPATIFRLPGVFGKWCKPNYNSVVATFCHNVARGRSIDIHDPNVELRLVYIDDVVSSLIAAISSDHAGTIQRTVEPEYRVTVGELADQIRAFEACRTSLVSERVGTGFGRALYATYVSYLPVERFAYGVPEHADPRGVFVEMLKTHDSGQFSYFTAHPGVTRGGHYHHTKSEKFLVIKGRALFRFRHLLTDEVVELTTSGDEPQVVDTIPGWSHDITNIGDDEMVVMLWANEIFDPERPDTISSEV